jgi:methionyl aminopeptidase
MIIIKDEQALQRMREACRVAAKVRDTLARSVAPGVTTLDLSEYAGRLIKGFGATSAFFGYRGFPGQICVSINASVVHGIPGGERVKLGDVVSLDVGVHYEGYTGDTATSVMVGVTDPRVIQLVRATEKALSAGIAKAEDGNRLSDVSHAIERTAVGSGFTVVREYVGHGIGRELHEDPQIPNFGPPGRGPKLKRGMTLAIEPMVNMGVADVQVQGDGWTVLTADRLPSAHFEHTVAVGNGQAEIMTLSDPD